MEFERCYEIAEYVNDNHKGCFSKKEIACRAFEIFEEIKWARRSNHLPDSLQETIKVLYEDNCYVSDEYATDLIKSCGFDVEATKARIALIIGFRELYYNLYSFMQLVEEYEEHTGNTINDTDKFVDMYPFSYSLNDMPHKVGEWGEWCTNSLIKEM